MNAISPALIPKWQGSYGVMLTPFHEDGSVNFDEFARQLEIQCESDTHGVIICGSTGEFPFLGEMQINNILTCAAQVVDGRKAIIGGVALPSAKLVIERLERLQRLGYDGALVTPPTYYRYENSEITAFYQALSDADIGIPLIAYQISAFTNSIGMDTFKALLECKAIEALKNSDQNIAVIASQIQYRNSTRRDFAVLTGTESAFLPSLAAGCDGGFTAFGALHPNEMAGIYRQYQNGNFKEAQAMQQALLPLMNLCASITFPIGYKIYGELLGLLNCHYPQTCSAQLKEKMQSLREELYTLNSKTLDFPVFDPPVPDE